VMRKSPGLPRRRWRPGRGSSVTCESTQMA
jgi:hypothetical protein